MTSIQTPEQVIGLIELHKLTIKYSFFMSDWEVYKGQTRVGGGLTIALAVTHATEAMAAWPKGANRRLIRQETTRATHPRKAQP